MKVIIIFHFLTIPLVSLPFFLTFICVLCDGKELCRKNFEHANTSRCVIFQTDLMQLQFWRFWLDGHKRKTILSHSLYYHDKSLHSFQSFFFLPVFNDGDFMFSIKFVCLSVCDCVCACLCVYEKNWIRTNGCGFAKWLLTAIMWI